MGKRGRPKMYKTCTIKDCNGKYYAKGLCFRHYTGRPEWRKKISERRKFRCDTDKEFRERERKRARANAYLHFIKKMREDPQYNAKRQREYRKRHPEKFTYIMCRCYFRKLTKEQKKNLIEECGMK